MALTGDWAKLQHVLSDAGIKIRRESSRSIRRSLSTIERAVLSHIDEQDLDWDPLSEAYAARKEKQGLSPDILRATNQMYQNITTAQPDSYRGMVGVQRGVKSGNGDELTDIALIHEQPDDDGTIIPARKLWQPTFEETKDEVAAELKGVAIRVFKR